MNSKGIAGFNTGLVKSATGDYTPTEWATGDVITADKLNHMEEGISEVGDNTFTVHFNTKNGQLVSVTETFADVCNALYSGTRVNAIETILIHSDVPHDNDPRYYYELSGYLKDIYVTFSCAYMSASAAQTKCEYFNQLEMNAESNSFQQGTLLFSE